jgi:hypothetical protein
VQALNRSNHTPEVVHHGVVSILNAVVRSRQDTHQFNKAKVDVGHALSKEWLNFLEPQT